MLADFVLPAARSALRRPGFSLLIVLLVALSLGLATAAGNLAREVFLRPLPFAQAERLFVLSSTNPPEGWWEAPGSVAEFKHYQREARLDDQLAVFFDQGSLNVSPAAPGAPVERVPVSYVEHNFFSLLGVPPALGRGFVPEETREGAAPAVVVISHRFWQAKLGARPDVVGATLRLNDRAYEIVGVMPAGFRDVSLESGNPEVWLPFPLAAGPLGPELYSNYTLRRCRALLRLDAQASRSVAQQEADAIAQGLNRERPADMEGRGFIVQPLRHYYFWRVQSAVAALALGSLLVLVVAAVNLVNLLLVESLRRRQEFAVRAALGADGRRLAAALLAMSLVPVLVGGALAVTIALALTAWLREAGVMALPEFVRLELSLPGIVGGVGGALALAALAAVVPWHQARRLDLREALQAAGKGTAAAGGSRARNLLVAAEVTLATLLLAGTGLAAKSLWELVHRPTGYRAEQLLTMTTQIDRTRHVTPAARADLIRQIDAAMRRAPAASAATIWNGGMLGLGWWVTNLTPGHLDAADPKNARTFQRNGTVPGGLATLGIRLLRGRDFSEDATPGQPVEIIIDERVAAALWPGEDPIGKTVFQNMNPARPGIVIGIAAPARHRGRTFDESRNTGDAYFPAFQAPMDQVNLMFRVPPGAESATVEFARQQLARLDPTMAIFDVQLMEQRLGAEASVPRFTAMALGMFATISLLLTALGVYGVLAFATAQRTREFGVRLAVGAPRGRVLTHVLAGGGRWIGAGIGVGLVLAAFATPLMAAILVGVRPHDPFVLAGAGAIVGVIGLCGAAIPAWRASRVDPLTALRAE
jgi:predicted permease